MSSQGWQENRYPALVTQAELEEYLELQSDLNKRSADLLRRMKAGAIVEHGRLRADFTTKFTQAMMHAVCDVLSGEQKKQAANRLAFVTPNIIEVVLRQDGYRPRGSRYRSGNNDGDGSASPVT